MTFLTAWRMALAADLLLEPGTSVASVARQVGYSSPFALSTAFKRTRGISPHQHRARARQVQDSSTHHDPAATNDPVVVTTAEPRGAAR